MTFYVTEEIHFKCCKLDREINGLGYRRLREDLPFLNLTRNLLNSETFVER